MTRQNYIELFDQIYPGFFERENIRSLPADEIFDEMVLWLEDFEPGIYRKELDDSVSFGFFEGSFEEIHQAVEKVEPNWIQYYDGESRVYCGYINGKIASFCQLQDKGEQCIDGCSFRTAAPACVGSVPEYRDRGIGLTMIQNVTQILKEEGYDCSYIHYTGVAPWYAKLGYQSTCQWNSGGIIPSEDE